MSMTQLAFLTTADIPTNGQIQDTIQKLGYDFKILGSPEKQIDNDGLKCSIDGHQTYFETWLYTADNAITDNEADWVKPDITNQDIAISFVWGADFAAGASIGLISLALIDLSNALIYYMDDQMRYSREMLLDDTPRFLEELSKKSSTNGDHKRSVLRGQTGTNSKNTLWGKIKNIFK